MQNLSFEDGYKEFTVNEDPERKIRFNPADLSILERFNTARKSRMGSVILTSIRMDPQP